MRLIRLMVLILAALALSAGISQADRKPTLKEKTQIASVVHLPLLCAKVRVSTESKKPKWARVAWRDGGSQCEPLASNGVTVVKKSKGSWRFITAGSSFTCGELYAKVPKNVAADLKIDCATTQ